VLTAAKKSVMWTVEQENYLLYVNYSSSAYPV